MILNEDLERRQQAEALAASLDEAAADLAEHGPVPAEVVARALASLEADWQAVDDAQRGHQGTKNTEHVKQLAPGRLLGRRLSR